MISDSPNVPEAKPWPRFLWSFSTIYEKGKFVADGKFDANAVSKQCGAALLLKVMQSHSPAL